MLRGSVQTEYWVWNQINQALNLLVLLPWSCSLPYLHLSFISLKMGIIICPFLTSQGFVSMLTTWLGSPLRRAGTEVSVLFFQEFSFSSGADVANSKAYTCHVGTENESSGPR